LDERGAGPTENSGVKAHKEAAQAVAIMFRPGDVVELRVPKGGAEPHHLGLLQRSGRAGRGDPRDGWKRAGSLRHPEPVKPDLLARASNRVKAFAETTTSDSDILERRWMLVDCDPVRPAGISSSRPNSRPP